MDPASPVLWLWAGVELEPDDLEALSSLLTALGTFGRSESWCEATLLSDADIPNYSVNCEPCGAGPGDPDSHSKMRLGKDEFVRVLLPEEKRGDEVLRSLFIETAAMRRKKILDPPGSRYVTYRRQQHALSARTRQVVARRESSGVVTVARFALSSTVLPLVQDSLPFAECVRRAVIRHRLVTSHSEAISGKTVDGEPLTGHEHAHYLATDEDHDGRVDHITLHAPGGFDSGDLGALQNVRTIERRKNGAPVRMLLIGLGTTADFPGVSLFARSCLWRSVTPFALPWFPNRGGGKAPRPRDLPEAQLRRQIKLKGLPTPQSIVPIAGYVAGGRREVRWLEYHASRYNGTRGNGLAGFEIEFPEPVRGPITLGFACHFGLGLFLPVT